jgi:prolyl-tRNA editing enzyme YbaK/EbsC (Cys-tRNA(Pro) deacylase)
MSPAGTPASARVIEAFGWAGLAIEVREHATPTRTAEEAAAACGCPIGAIVKSLVFAVRDTGEPRLLLVSGANRVDEAAVAGETGEALVRPDAKAVRAWTGFAIGGIPPLGHTTALPTFLDRDLLDHARVWAAAGTPTSVFAIAPRDLVGATGATIIRVA